MPEPKLPKTPKKYNPKDQNPCEGCSNCCEYLALEIDKPTTVKDFDHILWYVLHKDVWVYIEDDGSWNIQFNTPCEKLDNRRCNYYSYRPSICRSYSPSDCPRYEGEVAEKYLFKNEIDFLKYLKAKRPSIFKKLNEKISVPSEV